MEPEQERGRERRRRILDAGMTVFARKGYRAAAVDDIAAESGSSKGGVYFHFPNKQAIFLALLDRMGALLLDRVEAAMVAEADPIDRGDAALRAVLHTFAGHRALARLFLVEAMGAGREFSEAMSRQHDRFTDLIRRHLDDAVAQGAIAPLDTEITAVAWFGAVNEVTTRWVLTNRPERLEDAYPALRAVLARGVGAENVGASGATEEVAG